MGLWRRMGTNIANTLTPVIPSGGGGSLGMTIQAQLVARRLPLMPLRRLLIGMGQTQDHGIFSRLA